MKEIRRIASNYLLLPNMPLMKYAYVIVADDDEVRVCDTDGRLHEIACLEFYGGMIVADYVIDYFSEIAVGEDLIPFIHKCYALNVDKSFTRVALIEGADLQALVWTSRAKWRLI